MRILVNAKHWQIFVISLGIIYIQRTSGMKVMNGKTSEIFFDISFIAYYMVTIGWILFTGIALNNRQTDKKLNFQTPKITGLLLMLSCSTLALSMTLDETFEFAKNNSTLWLVFILYSLVSLIIICTYSAKALKLNEEKGEVDINDYFGDILALLLWPIGIWFIQPRVNRLFQTTDKGQSE